MRQDTWQSQLAASSWTLSALCAHLELDPAQCVSPESLAAADEFMIRAPHAFLSRIEKGNPNDPLLKQILPTAEEQVSSPHYVKDPLNEAAYRSARGIIHKYRHRVLLTLSGACAIACRYCFRRHYPYQSEVPSQAQWQQALDYLQAHPDIQEVILSGGDPLMWKDKRLAQLFEALSEIPHLRRLRIHTRLPVVLPDRITPTLMSLLEATRFDVVLVSHINHPAEIDQAVIEAFRALRGVHLLNQSVLLKGVNDQVDTLCALSHRLFAAGILPYYLHLLDPVAGSGHFFVSEENAVALMRELCDQLPGYLVPRLAQEVTGAGSKRWVAIHA